MSALVPSRDYFGVDIYDFLIRSCTAVGIFCACVYATFTVSPWIRLRLMTENARGYRFAFDLLVCGVLVAGFVGVLLGTAVLSYMYYFFEYAYEDEIFFEQLMAHYDDNPDRFFGMTKVAMLSAAEAFCRALFGGIVYVWAEIVLVTAYRGYVIPWFVELPRPGRALTVKSARILTIVGWSAVAIFVLWLLGVWTGYYNAFTDWSFPQITPDEWRTDDPTRAGNLLSATKRELLLIAEFLVTSTVIIGLIALSAYVLRPAVMAVIGFVGRWPTAYRPSPGPMVVVIIGTFLLVTLPHLYYIYPLFADIAGR